MTWTQCDNFFPPLSAERVPDFLGIRAALLLPHFPCWDQPQVGWLSQWGTFLQGSCVLQQLRSSPAPGPRIGQLFLHPFLLAPLPPSPSNPCPMPTSWAWRVSCTILSKRNLIHLFTHKKWTQSYFHRCGEEGTPYICAVWNGSHQPCVWLFELHLKR